MDTNDTNGRFNKSADKVPRVDATWSDDNLTKDYDPATVIFQRLKCRNCGATDRFEVVITHVYETSAKCTNCGMYYVVHAG